MSDLCRKLINLPENNDLSKRKKLHKDSCNKLNDIIQLCSILQNPKINEAINSYWPVVTKLPWDVYGNPNQFLDSLLKPIWTELKKY